MKTNNRLKPHVFKDEKESLYLYGKVACAILLFSVFLLSLALINTVYVAYNKSLFFDFTNDIILNFLYSKRLSMFIIGIILAITSIIKKEKTKCAKIGLIVTGIFMVIFLIVMLCTL